MENTNEGTNPLQTNALTTTAGIAANEEGLEGAFEEGGVVAPSMLPVVDEGSLAYEPKPLSLGKIFVYSSGSVGNGVWVSLNNYLQSFFLISLGAPPILYALLGSQRGFEGAIIQPLIGAWSDRIRTRFGRRRIFILRFMPICILFTVITPFVPQFVGAEPILGIDPKLLSLILVSVTIFLFSVTYNISQDPYSALMADITPQRQRGMVNGIVQSVSFVGQISILLVFLFLHAPYTLLYPVAGAALLIFYLPTVLGIREPKKLPGANEHKRYRLGDYWRAVRADNQIQFFYATQFFLWFGINSVVTFITPYATYYIGFTPFAAATLPIVLVVAIAATAWPLGLLSDRLSLKGVFLTGLFLMAAASITAVFLKEPLALYIILAIAGIGYAGTQATGYPMLTRLVYPQEMGLYTGLNTTVSSIAAPISGVVAGALVTGLGYGVLFAVVGASFTFGLVPLALLRMGRSPVVRARAAAAAAAVGLAGA